MTVGSHISFCNRIRKENTNVDDILPEIIEKHCGFNQYIVENGYTRYNGVIRTICEIEEEYVNEVLRMWPLFFKDKKYIFNFIKRMRSMG